MSAAIPYTIIDTIELRHTKIELRSDDIIQFTYGENIRYSMQETQELEESVIEISKGKTYKSLRIAGKYSDIDMEVMNYLSKGRGILFTLADAFVIHSMPQKLLANFYLGMNKPLLPTKFFTETLEAENWLQSLNMEDLLRLHTLKINQQNL